MPPNNLPMIVVGEAAKRRLDEMQAELRIERGRKSVTMSEVIESLIAEHDARAGTP